ncbi:MAG: coproporphyrinogen-III oxidase family protein [Acidobacteria bacterium]|nr:coproporphyrinogen-III oxidase family protein [Acidobacteriota bacterium]MDA1234283.1 coproporphyrinogen-III oxidase family protein [Acidobacteriota bacterium]
MTERLNDKVPEEETKGGSYFVSNYPPYGAWSPSRVGDALSAFERPPEAETPLGVYLHIPFCRKRCTFCYFKVYTDKDASEIQAYLAAAIHELKLYSRKPFIGGRKPKFIYFGGGTPSYLSSTQLTGLVREMQALLPWDEAEEVAFECEPGTLTEKKLRVIKELGVTRLSLGVENFDDEILQTNGRAHVSKEIFRSYDFLQSLNFPQVNIDLIAGMVGETDENWRKCITKTIEMSPDSVTIYQMEVPYNTKMFKEMLDEGKDTAPVANWKTKRAWVDYAFNELEQSGYTVTSAYTAVKDPQKTKFLYRDLLWTGADLVGVGVASFSHVGGVHYQNEADVGPYLAKVNKGEFPIYRALKPTEEERMIRELILQMKLGRVQPEYFQDKFGVDVGERFAAPVGKLSGEGYMKAGPEIWQLSRNGLLQVDRLLPEFFLPEHRPAA